MNSFDYTRDEFALAGIRRKENELKSDLEMPSGPVSEAEIPPVSTAGANKSRYKRA